MLTFEEVTEDNMHVALEITNSNPFYNTLENGSATRTVEELRTEFLTPATTSALIKNGDTYVGLIDYLMLNPNDQHPWLGLLMIHSDCKGQGFGKQAYLAYEQLMRERGVDVVRLGVLKGNDHARKFWEQQGFVAFKSMMLGANEVVCMEKGIGS
ncbi:MAG: GNAT family N-acetyltransferase [Tumebacillaceae bacterium]